MTDTPDRIADIECRLAEALRNIERLTANEAIRDCIMRFCRGLDRSDRALMASAFHDDAMIDFGRIYTGAVDGFLDATIASQAKQSEIQHLIGNILVRIEDDQATAESYELARHKTPREGTLVDLILAMRYLDRFERRDGAWRIIHRTKVMDWARIMTGADDVYDNSPLDKATRDEGDPSYAVLGWPR